MTTTSSKEATVVLILYTEIRFWSKFVFYDFLKIDCYLMSSKQYFSYVHSENKHTVNYVGKKVADGRTCVQKRRLPQNTAHKMISSENVLIVAPGHLRSL